MSRLRLHPEHHLVGRIGWLRAAVLGANDGIISTASLIVGVAAAAAAQNDVLRIIPQPRHGPQRPDCVAEVVGFELRNVVANYPFQRSHRFPGIEPNSGHRDYSRLSCGVGEARLGPSPSGRRGRQRSVAAASR
jgi:hypothetical protein